MYLISLSPIANQTFTVTIENINYRVALRTIQGLTYMSVWADGDELFQSQLCAPNAFVNPYNYVSVSGKFYFRCSDGQYPYFKNFGNTVELYYYTAEEIANA